jgi:hypothetical protein
MGLILGIGNESGVGKDTFAMFLIDYLRSRKIKSLNIIREGFADRLYDLCFSFYSWAGFRTRQHYIINPADKQVVLPLIGKCPRQMLIEYSNALNAVDPNFALNAVVRDTTGFHLKIVPDVRRAWEFDALNNNPNAFLLRITKPGVDSKWEMDQELKNPPYLEKWHETIANDGDLSTLNNKAIEFAERIVLPRLYNHINTKTA